MKPEATLNDIHFQSIFESVPGNYLILAPDPPAYTIIAVSDAYAKATLTVREQILSRPLFEVFPDNPEDPHATGVNNLSASLQQVLLHQRPHKMAIQKYDIPAGNDKGFEERYWSPLNTPVIGANGEVRYIIHHVEDVTEKVRTEDALECQTEQLKRTNAKLEQFVRISSHDLQEPLRKIRTFAGLLNNKCRESLDSFALEMSNKMMVSAEKMTARVKDLQQYTYLHKQMDFVNVDLNEVLADVEEELALLIAEKQATIQAQRLPVIKGIKHQLHQLFFNLVNNALKFSIENIPPVISITVKENVFPNINSNDRRPFCELVFTDNGIGFEQQYAERIFTLFERLQTGRMDIGTGMGLAFCKMVVENHGGKIMAFSEPCKGARFHVLLPVK